MYCKEWGCHNSGLGFRLECNGNGCEVSAGISGYNLNWLSFLLLTERGLWWQWSGEVNSVLQVLNASS